METSKLKVVTCWTEPAEVVRMGCFEQRRRQRIFRLFLDVLNCKRGRPNKKGGKVSCRISFRMKWRYQLWLRESGIYHRQNCARVLRICCPQISDHSGQWRTDGRGNLTTNSNSTLTAMWHDVIHLSKMWGICWNSIVCWRELGCYAWFMMPKASRNAVRVKA